MLIGGFIDAGEHRHFGQPYGHCVAFFVWFSFGLRKYSRGPKLACCAKNVTKWIRSVFSKRIARNDGSVSEGDGLYRLFSTVRNRRLED